MRERLLARKVQHILEAGGIDIPPPTYKRVRERLWQEWKHAYGRHGKEFTLIHFLTHLSKAFKLTKLKAERLARKLEAVIYESDLNALAPTPGAQETVRSLKSKGYLLGVVSNSVYSRGHIVRILEKIGVRRWLDTIVVSSAEGIAKPNVEIFRRAACNLKVRPNEVVFVGDRIDVDMVGAKKAGMRTIWLSKNRASKPTKSVDTKLSKLSRVPDLVEGGGKRRKASR